VEAEVGLAVVGDARLVAEIAGPAAVDKAVPPAVEARDGVAPAGGVDPRAWAVLGGEAISGQFLVQPVLASRKLLCHS